MSTILYPNQRKYEGPFLVSSSNLNDFNLLIDNVKSIFNTKIPDDTKKKINTATEFLVEFKSDKTFKHENLLDIFKLPEFNKDEILTIKATIIRGDNKFFAEIGDKIRFSSYSQEQSIINESLYESDKWIEKINSNPIIKVWKEYAGLFILIFIFSLLSLIPDSKEGMQKEIYKNKLKEEALQLINDTISSTNQNKAIEIILKLSSDYYDNNLILTSNNWERINNKAIKIVIIIASFILIFAPSTSFEFGKGKSKYKFWKFWIRFITITIPTTIIIPILLSKLNF